MMKEQYVTKQTKQKPKLYLLNSLITPINFDVYESKQVRFTKLPRITARDYVNSNKYEVISAIGHESTAKILSKILNYPVQVNRISVFLNSGDFCLHFFLRDRLPEGKVLDEQELDKIIAGGNYWLVLSEVL